MNSARERELLARLHAPPAGRFAALNDIEMYYEVHGAGEPLLLLHGFTQAGPAWTPLLPSFSDSHRVIVPDLRGHGRSTNPSGAFTHRQSAEDVAALLGRLDIERCRAIGFSSGGMTLLHLATRQPERIERMARGHWGFEDRLRWELDVAFREYASRVRSDHAAENLAVLRQIALDLSRRETCLKLGIRAKRLGASWDHDFLLKILHS